jgi:ParB family chromosome partitioning protein
VNPRPGKGRALGRGLDALLPSRPSPAPASQPVANEPTVFACPLEKLRPQRSQPRQHFDSNSLDELARSIRERGVIQPLVVRRLAHTDCFEIVAGERRWRAAQRAGLREVMVVVREASADEAFELALIENVQREDLNPIEFAEGAERLLKEHGYTQDSLAQRLGKDRSTIANALRLLRLPAAVRSAVIHGELSEGHARSLLGLGDEESMAALAEKVIRGRLSVRQTEAMVRSAKRQARGGSAAVGQTSQKSPAVRDLETRLQRKLGTKCEVRDKDGRGQILISYSSWDELDRLLDALL